jgi:hypothetical protein
MICLTLRDAERTLQASWRAEYWREDKGRRRVHPARRDEARTVLAAGEGGTGALSQAIREFPGIAGNNLSAFQHPAVATVKTPATHA